MLGMPVAGIMRDQALAVVLVRALVTSSAAARGLVGAIAARGLAMELEEEVEVEQEGEWEWAAAAVAVAAECVRNRRPASAARASIACRRKSKFCRRV